MNMQIWAGSGSSFNGKETVRRRSMTPKKTAKSLGRRKSSAKIGSGLDGLSSDEVEESSLISSPSPNKDSIVDSEMTSDAFLPITKPYDVDEGMAKPLNLRSLDDDSKNVDAVGWIEHSPVQEKEKKRRMGQDRSDSFENFPTPKKSKGGGINVAMGDIADDLRNSCVDVLKEIEHTIQRLEGDLKSAQSLKMDGTSYDMVMEALSLLSSN
ncbi:hypothetical protein EYC84_008784 [Monilinia fructicola]|uniref:Uncharacterized protein n=1 Tax=Monilinia fructicola TaxID=38448 RepID=A0A5M9JED1_MONFR|nr:hypothetical protein EYC84_008784 [Monilinia fructicola]